jgi:hypothetical protein
MIRRPACLAPQELVDLVEGVLPADRAAHAASCDDCRRQAAALAETLAELGAVDVPEPSPFFWAAINRRVAGAIAADRGSAPTWLRWDTLVPLAGLAALLMALGSALTPTVSPAGAPVAAALESAPAGDAGAEPTLDAALDLVAALVGTLPDAGVETLELAPLPDLGDVAATSLTAAEQAALEALLRDAVDRPAS